VQTLASSRYAIEEAISHADLIIGAVLVVGAAAPKLVTREMLNSYRTVQCLLTLRLTRAAVLKRHMQRRIQTDLLRGRRFALLRSEYAGRVPRTSTFALTNATLPYALDLANKGFERAIREDKGLLEGVNTFGGKLTYEAVATSQNLSYTPARFDD
jgi:alanine dehydrogenase